MKITQTLLLLLSHVSIILALCFLTFTVLDWYNPLMGFTTNSMSTMLLVAFCIVSILTAALNLVSIARAQRQTELPARARKGR